MSGFLRQNPSISMAGSADQMAAGHDVRSHRRR